MKSGIISKIFALFLTVLMVFDMIPAFAQFIYSPGPTEYELDRDYLLYADSVELSGENLVFSEGGEAKFDLLLPFDSDGLEISYEQNSADVHLTITTEENAYETTLTAGSASNTIAITELMGSSAITLKTDKAVTVTGIKFLKINEKYNKTNSGEIPLTDYEYALLTSIVFKDNAPIAKVRGAIQRLDYDNTFLAPMNIDGRLYLPFEKIAEALGYYSEDYPDKAYIYMAGEADSMALIAGKGYIESDEYGRRDFSLDVVYKGNKAWVPVRKLAEALGFTVCYKDGYVVIDDRLAAQKVIEDEIIFAELKSEFEPYIVTERVIGQTYHVAKNNSNAKDTNDGTEDAPFLTIQEAATRAKAGDTVIIHAGTYRETVKPENSGTAVAPITFKAAGDGEVVISALERISGFTAYKGDIFTASAKEDLGFGRNQLFYKGEALTAGRHPNSDTKPGVVPYPEGVPEGVYATRGNICITEENGNVAYSDSDLEQPENYWQGGTFVTLKGQGWCLVSGDIVSSAPGSLVLKDHDGTKSYNLGLVGSPSHNGTKYFTQVLPSDYGYITNHINTLDKAGEWHMEGNSLYLIPPEGADLNNDFEIKERQLCIDLRDKQFVTFDGINTIGGGITLSGDNTEGCVLNHGTHRYIAHHSVLLDQSNYAMYADEPLKSLKTVKGGEAGICISGKNNAVINSTIDYSSATGINLIGKYAYIRNNVISNTAYSGGYTGGIRISPDASKGSDAKDVLIGGHFITCNTLCNAGRSLLSQGSTISGVAVGVSPNEIAYNRFYNGVLSSRDTGITYEYGYTGGNDKAKTRMHHNFIYNLGYKDEDTDTIAMMLYHDGLVAARDTYSNVTYYEELDKAPGHQVYVQDSSVTVVRNRNNATLGYLPGGEVKTSDYPGARTFEPGADHDIYPRSMDSYNDFKQNYKPYYPTSVSGDKKTITFENVNIEGNKRLLANIFLTRKVGENTPLNITARLYSGEALVQTTSFTNVLQSQRFYVKDLHRGLVFLKPTQQGSYRLEIEMSDATVDVKKLVLESFDSEYDNLYTKEMKEAGVIAYAPVSSEEADGKHAVTFENVYIEAGKKTALKLHTARDFVAETKINITAEVYDSTDTQVAWNSLQNSLKHTENNINEALQGLVVIPEIESSGYYKVKMVLSDTHSEALRLIAEDAGSDYDNLFRDDVILGGSLDEWDYYKLETVHKISATAVNTPERVAKFLNYTAGNCYSNILTFKDRTVKEDAEYIRVTHSSFNDSTNGNLSGGVVKLYVDDKNAEPIATWTTDDTAWKPASKYVKLNKTLTKGKHTFYMTFEYPNDPYRATCSTLWNFSFCNEAWDGEALDGLHYQQY